MLKNPKEFRLLGQSMPRLDIPEKVNGQAVFGIDVKRPDLLIARVVRCPVFGGTVASFNADKAKAVAGVRHVVKITGGIAVVADNYWAASKGAEALEVKWNEGPLARLSSSEILTRYKALAEQEGKVARNDGDTAAALRGNTRAFERVFEVPFLAHACMEPMNCTADVRGNRVDIWVPTQGQTASQAAAAAAAGVQPAAVNVHTTYLGGGFGRRAEADFVMDAVETSKAVGKPVKVIWTREDDMQHDFYRPITYVRMWGALDASGKPDRVQATHGSAIVNETHRATAAEWCGLHFHGRRGESSIRDSEYSHRVHGNRSRSSVWLLAFGGRVRPGLRGRSVHR